MNISLNKGDRICFLGDSITANGGYIAEIFEYFKNNYSELEVGFYNCGISGARGYEFNLKNRMFCDCLSYFPKYISVMFGVNDSHPWLYNPDNNDADREEAKKKQNELYPKTLERIVQFCGQYGIIPIICTPTPYDEYNDLPSDNIYLNTHALSYYADAARNIAKKYNLLLVDMHKVLIEHMKKKPIGDDRFHPNELGHHLMAEQFLCTIGAKQDLEENPIVLSEINKERHEIERRIRKLMYVERDGAGFQHTKSLTVLERKEIIQKRIAENAISAQLAENYFDDIDILDELRGELLEKTLAMYI